MADRPLRFVHASDLHLERPIGGLADVPDAMRDVLAEAPYRAAERLFDTVLSEGAELLILSGDVLMPRSTGPRGPAFLVEQFERLRSAGVSVYWAGGEVDPPEAWPAAVPLSDNVHVFARNRPQEIIHLRDGEPVARLTGLSRRRGRKIRAGDFLPEHEGPFSVAVTYGAGDCAPLAVRGVGYWALGGKHARDTQDEAGRIVHYPGTLQGRDPGEPGCHGCTLVEVHGQRAECRFVPADSVRWLNETVVVDAAATPEDLWQMLSQRAGSLAAGSGGLDLLVAWRIEGGSPILAELRRQTLADRLTRRLNEEYAQARPVVYTARLAAESHEPWPAAWYEEETILGDFMRTIRDLEPRGNGAMRAVSSEAVLSASDLAAGLTRMLGKRHRDGILSTAARLDEPAALKRVLAKAAALGADLLREEP